MMLPYYQLLASPRCERREPAKKYRAFGDGQWTAPPTSGIHFMTLCGRGRWLTAASTITSPHCAGRARSSGRTSRRTRSCRAWSTRTCALYPRLCRGSSPHNPGFLTVIVPGSPGYALYPSAQVARFRVSFTRPTWICAPGQNSQTFEVDARTDFPVLAAACLRGRVAVLKRTKKLAPVIPGGETRETGAALYLPWQPRMQKNHNGGGTRFCFLDLLLFFKLLIHTTCYCSGRVLCLQTDPPFL